MKMHARFFKNVRFLEKVKFFAGLFTKQIFQYNDLNWRRGFARAF